MVNRTFIEKSNTLFKDSEENFGLNPIGMLNYGNIVSRFILYFKTDKMEKNGQHFLKMTNCGSIEKRVLDEMKYNSNTSEKKERACSFNMIAFRIPEKWDAGKGFDNSTDFWLAGKGCSSTNGSNWYYAYNGKTWGTKINESGYTITEEGVYDIDFLENEYEKFLNKEKSVIINSQHFDTGNEDINIDISDFINGIISNEYENNGICLAFEPSLERKELKNTQYYSFFTDYTNTFFHPVIESRYENDIIDDRYSFYIGKTNRLYFYANLGDKYEDLDELPSCEIKGVKYEVNRQKRGVYYADVKLTKDDAFDKEIIYDIWGNLIYSGNDFEDVEMEFVAHKKEDYFKFGESVNKISNLKPSLYGINDNEELNQGDERTINVIFKIPYSNDYELLNNCDYRLYVKDGKREIDVIDWDKIETIGKSNSFRINSGELIPNKYFIDIRAKIGNDMRIFKNKLCFTIIDNITNIKK